MLKTAFLYLVVGILLGLLMYLYRAFPDLALYSVRSVHVHLILVGAFLQIIMGVALWMFPRKREFPHYTLEREGMTLYVIFNLGTVLRSVFNPLDALSPLYYWLTFAGMSLQILGIAFFVFLIFKRIRVPGQK